MIDVRPCTYTAYGMGENFELLFLFVCVRGCLANFHLPLSHPYDNSDDHPICAAHSLLLVLVFVQISHFPVSSFNSSFLGASAHASGTQRTVEEMELGPLICACVGGVRNSAKTVLPGSSRQRHSSALLPPFFFVFPYSFDFFGMSNSQNPKFL